MISIMTVCLIGHVFLYKCYIVYAKKFSMLLWSAKFHHNTCPPETNRSHWTTASFTNSSFFKLFHPVLIWTYDFRLNQVLSLLSAKWSKSSSPQIPALLACFLYFISLFSYCNVLSVPVRPNQRTWISPRLL